MVILPTEKRFDWNNPPVVLLFLVISNILIFFLYQSGDSEYIHNAFTEYEKHDFLELEWPIYQDYLEGQGELSKKLDELKAKYDEEYYSSVSIAILYDTGFYQYLLENKYKLFDAEFIPEWERIRHYIQEQINNTSYKELALTPSDLNVLTLISSQFLHGSVMHLLGNLFFLVVCGFAVEAAIGHKWFLLFYLTGGVVAGLSHALLDLKSNTPLVGASGAISAVMAMYLGIFRFKKIEFFYWFFIFVGYFRAPAVWILPVYIGMEVLQYASTDGSNIAYMAHVGGFVSGALLIAILLLFKKDALDEEYIEQNQNVDPSQLKQERIYQTIENYSFDKALLLLEQSLQEGEPSFSMRNKLLKANMLSSLQRPELKTYVREVLLEVHKDVAELGWQHDLFLSNHAVLKLNNKDLLQLGLKYCALDDISTSEEIFNFLKGDHFGDERMYVLAGKIAYFYKQLGNGDKAKKYQEYADLQFEQGSFS